jgi:hypothetical protein
MLAITQADGLISDMSRVFVSEATGVSVYVFSNDHCPPHVSARHRGEEWIARVRFSYLNAAVVLWSVEPLTRAPAINRLLGVVRGQLSGCRRAWWNAQRTVCLENQWVRLSANGLLEPLARRVPDAKQIDAAFYDVDSNRLRVKFFDGTSAEVRVVT